MGAQAATRPCWPATRSRGCCDTAPVRAVRAAIHSLGVAWELVGHTSWVSWASLGFGEPGSVLTQFLTRF